MLIPKWKNPNRKRKVDISYDDKDYTKYYDIDINDFQSLLIKLKNNIRLSTQENDRYGTYILTIALIVQEGKKFKMKPSWEREQILEQQYYELLYGLPTFNPDKGRLYSYAYRIGYTSACHWYTNQIEFKKEQDAIIAHCKQELEEYYDEYSDHKTRTTEYDR